MSDPANLISAIQAKLQTHESILVKSSHGSLTWRRQANGSWHIEFKPTL